MICNQAKVGSLRLGCRTAHQTACCYDLYGETSPTWAYATCESSGESGSCAKSGQYAKCLDGYDHFVVVASQGSGEDQKCKMGKSTVTLILQGERTRYYSRCKELLVLVKSSGRLY